MSEQVTGMERERRLMRASADYVTGRIDRAEFERLEALYRPDYRAIAEGVARHMRRLRPWWKRWLP